MFAVALAVLGLAADLTPNEEKLLAKGNGYFVHAVRSGPLSRGEFGERSHGRGVFERPGKYVLTHLNTATGKLTRLHAGGQWGDPSVLGGINRGFLYRQYIWGVAADEKYLYVLVGRTLEVTEDYGERGRKRKVPSTVIQVFSLTGAELVQEVALAKALHTEAETLTYDKLDRVPLIVTKTGLIVGDEKKPHARFRFTDRRKLEPEPTADKK
jgi:hypothetical protein